MAIALFFPTSPASPEAGGTYKVVDTADDLGLEVGALTPDQATIPLRVSASDWAAAKAQAFTPTVAPAGFGTLAQPIVAGDAASDSAALTVSLASPATAGNLLVAFGLSDGHAGSTPPLVSTGWTVDYYASSSGGMARMVASRVAAGGETEITVDPTTSARSTIALAEIIGPFAAVPRDIQTAPSGSTTNQIAMTGGPTTQADEVAFAVYFNRDRSVIGGTRSATNGYSEIFCNAGAVVGAKLGLIVFSKVLTATGLLDTTVSHNGATVDGASNPVGSGGTLVSYKKAA